MLANAYNDVTTTQNAARTIRQSSALLGLSVSAVVLCACGGENLSFSTYEIGEIDFGSANHIVLTDGFGQSDELDVLRARTANKIVDHGFFTVHDESAKRAVVIENEDGSFSLNNGDAFATDTLALEIDIIERYAHDDYVIEEQVDEVTGEVFEVLLPIRRAVLTLEAFLVADDGFAYLAAYAVNVEQESDDVDMTDEDLLAEATNIALNEIVGKIVPPRRRHNVPLDDSDESQQAMLDVAQGGDLDRAIEMADELLGREPHNEVAMYNKAVFTDAQGHYAEALSYYDTAIELDHAHAKDFYTDSRNDCFDRQQMTLRPVR